MGNYFSYCINTGQPHISFYGAEILKQEISSVENKGSIRNKIIDWTTGIFLIICIYRVFTVGFSFNGVISVVLLISIMLLIDNYLGRRVVISLKNGKSYGSSLLRLPEAEKMISDITDCLKCEIV